jgi:hypothetical protein
MTRLSRAAPSPMFPGRATCGRRHHPPGLPAATFLKVSE